MTIWMWIPIFRRDRREPALLPSLDGSPPSDQLRDSITWQSVIAICWFTALSNGFSHVLDVPFIWLFLAFLATALLLGALTLILLARRAQRNNAQVGQFSIATGLFVLLVLAALFGFSRWAADTAAELHRTHRTPVPEGFASWLAISVVLALISIPSTIWLVHSALWASIWLLRRRRKNDAVQAALPKISSSTEQATSVADKHTQ
jgi:uncharacterized membrane protein YidH (DUF202 family)